MSSLIIQPTLTDLEIQSTVALGKEIWTEHYSPIIGLNQVNYMLNKFQSLEAIKNQIKDGYFYYNLKIDKNQIGYFSVQHRKDKLFLSKVYIHKSLRGNGYFNQVLKFIENIAKENRFPRIELTVNKYNKNSISIYLTKGFTIIEETIFDIGQDYIMDDYILTKSI